MGYGIRIRRNRRRRFRINKRRAVMFLVAVIGIIIGVAAAIGGTVYYIENKPTKLRAEVNAIADIPVITDFVPEKTMERPGEQRKIKYIVIHETGNAGRNADAASHNNYLHTKAGSQKKSWHYTVDDREIYYHIPDNEIAFHAGDGLAQDGGNQNGIGIEMCINPESDYEQTLRNTAKLAAMLLKAYDLPLESLKKHEDFSGKHCPDILLSEGRWDDFVAMVEAELRAE
ncbi:hypothetical protein FRZ06_10370 [Anoxybacterium hadale]|uniref:Uncharacterized protein n=1 Tax=Anoxybacterium hadale TaxID=3408580 RepID=A0ACD1AC02_9FIRM|nr:hypothetical protein FRZ06_10370 [Clostridiales bacterium]